MLAFEIWMMILSNEFPLVWNRSGQIHAVVSNDELGISRNTLSVLVSVS